MSDSKTEVAQRAVTGFRYRFDCGKRTVVSVRNSDSFEFDRRAMTRDEAREHCGKEADDLMNQKIKERAEAHLNEEHGALTIKTLAGQNETTLAWMVAADCKCGRKIEAQLSEILSGRRKYCNARTCPIAITDREKVTPPSERPLESVKRRDPGKKSRPEDPPAQEVKPPPSEPPQPAEKTDGPAGLAYHINDQSQRRYVHINDQSQRRKPVATLAPFPEEFTRFVGWRGALTEEALLLRKTAVAILAGKVDPAELVKRLREQADKLDEIVYAEA